MLDAFGARELAKLVVGPNSLLRLLCGLSSPQFVRVRPLLFGAI